MAMIHITHNTSDVAEPQQKKRIHRTHTYAYTERIHTTSVAVEAYLKDAPDSAEEDQGRARLVLCKASFSWEFIALSSLQYISQTSWNF